MPPTVILVRHAQALHNLTNMYSDPVAEIAADLENRTTGFAIRS